MQAILNVHTARRFLTPATEELARNIEMNYDEHSLFIALQLAIVTWLCGNKRLNSFFRLQEVSDVLSKYVILSLDALKCHCGNSFVHDLSWPVAFCWLATLQVKYFKFTAE